MEDAAYSDKRGYTGKNSLRRARRVESLCHIKNCVGHYKASYISFQVLRRIELIHGSAGIAYGKSIYKSNCVN